MTFLTLTTDYGTKDPYRAMVRGWLRSRFPQSPVEDISHRIDKYDSSEAVFVLKTAFPFYPEGSIHLLDVSRVSTAARLAEEDSLTRKGLTYCITYFQNHWFVLPDQGLAGMLTDNPHQSVQRYPHPVTPLYPGFSLLNWLEGPLHQLLAGAVHADQAGILPEPWLAPETDPRSLWVEPAALHEGVLEGVVVYCDSYGNLHTNLSRATVEAFVGDREFTVYLRSQRSHENRSRRIHAHYHEVDQENLILLYNSAGCLEIALVQEPARALLGMRVYDKVLIEPIRR